MNDARIADSGISVPPTGHPHAWRVELSLETEPDELITDEYRPSSIDYSDNKYLKWEVSFLVTELRETICLGDVLGGNRVASVDLHLSEEFQKFVNEQVEVGEFNDAGAYIEALIARAKRTKEKLEALLIEGLDSGDAVALDADKWNRIRADVDQRLSNGG